MLTIWCNNDFSPADQRELALLTSSLSRYRVVMFDETDNSDTSSLALRNADIAFGYPDPDQVVQSETLRWVQLNSAGYTSYDRDDIKNRLISNRVILTNSSSVYDEPCAQHLLAMITSLGRQLPAALDSQRVDQGWPMASLRSKSRLLNQ